MIVSMINDISLRVHDESLTLHQYGTEELKNEVEFLFFPAVLHFEGVDFICLFHFPSVSFTASEQFHSNFCKRTHPMANYA